MLIDDLSGHPEHQVLWSFASGDATAGAMLEIVAGIAGEAFRGRRVLLDIRDPRRLVAAVIALDGLARQVLILPGGSEEVRNQIAAQFGPDLRLVDGPAPGSLEACPGLSPGADGPAREEAWETEWVLSTSGTTGVPKLVAHNLRSLRRTAQARSDRAGAYVWGLLYDLGRFAGLQVFLNALIAGSRLIVPPQELPLRQQLQMLAEKGCNALSATPTLWRQFLMYDLAGEFSMKQITLGGETADQAILTALRKAFPAARIVHIYASTEAGVGFSVRDGRAGFPRAFTEAPQGGVSLKVGGNGHLLLRPPFRGQSYLGDAGGLFDEDGFLDTGDLLRSEGDRFYFAGRSSGAINVGGSKVQPSEIEEAAYGFPGVLMARAYARKSHFTGAVVELEVVMDPQLPVGPELKEQLLGHFSRQLAPFKVPALIRIVEHIQVGGAGKLSRGES